MRRVQKNERDVFSRTLTASSQELEAALRQTRREMDRAWERIDEGWKDLQPRMTATGIIEPSDANEGTVRLNVGGSQVNVRRSALTGKQGWAASGWALGVLFEAVWDRRLPVDADGRLVLDESPAVVKFLVRALLTGAPGGQYMRGFGPHLIAADEKPLLPFVARALGLSDPIAMAVLGGSAILGPAVSGTSRAALEDWFPGETLELKYRATRNGWTSAAFHSKCDDSPRTATLFQVGVGQSASVVGGYSSVPWSGESGHKRSPGAFLFVLKDGTGGGQQSDPHQPAKWGIKHGNASSAVFRGAYCGPYFGQDPASLTSVLKGSPGILQITNGRYDIPTGSTVLQLNGQTVSEIEVFRVCPMAAAAPTPKAASSAPDDESSDAPAAMHVEGEDDFVRKFGVSIAGSLMEEHTALRDAEVELRRASAKVSAAAIALESAYGPGIPAGNEDPVVELSVRGTRMTTLRSTLQVCPDSALAARFDETRWPANEKDVDEHGRRVIDCSPSVFSKVLDVLRVRKRIEWAAAKPRPTVRVAVKAVDREAFEEFVNMQFPGCESFVIDYIDFLEETQSTL